MSRNLIPISETVCMSFGNLKSSNALIWMEAKLYVQSSGWLIYTSLQVKKFSASLTKYSDKKFMVDIFNSNHKLNFKASLTIHNNFKKSTISGRQRKIMMSSKTTKISSLNKIWKKLLSTWAIKKEIISYLSKTKSSPREFKKTYKWR